MNLHVDANQLLASTALRRRIAVIGSGISGLSAAWLLSSRHNVVVYEKERWAGGHSNTVDVDGPDGPIAVDTGFIVYNERNYPNLTALFDHLGVETEASNMSFAASLDNGAFEYASAPINSVVGQRSNVLKPRFWRMVLDILRFYGDARPYRQGRDPGSISLGAFLDQRDYSSALVDDHILPMCAAIWSTSPDRIRAFPLRSFIRFFSTHGLLEFGNRPEWRTVTGGSREYVAKLREPLGRRMLTGVGARRVLRHGTGVTVWDTAGNAADYDDVVIATHADQALNLLDDPSPQEASVLGAFRYTHNTAILHDDPALMPRRRRVWSSWNYIGGNDETGNRDLCVTYWMNRLQNLDRRQPLFVTLNPTRYPKPGSIKRVFDYTHPLFDLESMTAQEKLWDLQGRRRTWYCGSYFGYGFHEDGLQSGLAVAEWLGGVQRPWSVAGETNRVAMPQPAAGLELVA
ncbi:NAD(P)/FAD-dependent oxidoreductase [Bauldia sp.]|uniref:NAD(P)/FAD-dependent oxidoreductase n=1 Tax=Bauldia sp. TaxID=2575872 RepID=UPI003BAD18F9